MSNGKKLLNQLKQAGKLPDNRNPERDSEGLIVAIVKNGAHDKLNVTPNEFVNMVRRLVGQGCTDLGINQHLGYTLDSPENIILYLNSITALIQKAKPKTTEVDVQ